ncbi:MAG TPA: peptidoglycan-binding domain-containing protein [Kineosporiaceae bacterium]|nr:peptidoglycan-binding domain-containing protein [Kineosporiaceae bacterium]
MRLTRKRAAVAALAAVIVGVSGVAVAEIAQAATVTCNGRVMKAGMVGRTVVQEVYGEAGVPTRDGSLACRLTRGDSTGTDLATSPVYWLQLTLNECYGAELVIDGNYGSKTRAAVMGVQRDAGIEPDGVYGPTTRDHMSFYTRRSQRNGAFRSDCVPYGYLL